MKLIKQHLDEVMDFAIPVSSCELSNDDKAEVIGSILKHWILHNSPEKHFPGLELLALDWVWMDSDNRTLIQRIIYLMNQFKAIMYPSFYGKMGNRIRETIPAESRYILDFTRKFDWTSGQFGDGRSCFMNGGGRTGVVKEMILNGKFYAMRFYQTEPVVDRNNIIPLANVTPIHQKGNTKYFGKARVWLYYHELTVRRSGKMVTEPVYFMFNSYGKESLREMAAIFSAYVGASFRSCRLKNIGKAAGGLYLNAGSVIIGDKSLIKDITDFDFQFKTTYDQTAAGGRNARRMRREEAIRLPRRRHAQKNKFNWCNPPPMRYYKTQVNKKKRSTENKVRTRNELLLHQYYLSADIIREWFWQSRWNTGRFNNLIMPSKLRGSWKLLDYRYNGNFWSIIIKLLQIKMNGGFNDNPINSKNSGKPKDECSQPTLRRHEEDMPDEVQRPRDIIIDDPIHLEDR